MSRYICIHGHFYQPPRENPWLGEIEFQEEAKPYHDWNDRINDECYKRNGWARILDREGWLEKIVNNYENISFNFGPTLISWLERADPETYQRILEADRRSIEKFSGHGNAIAQCYNHIIMPLASKRDKHTQIIWGIRDFQSRFGRAPEGMWLPETAVDMDSLELMTDHGIKFTILAPHQTLSIRRQGDSNWVQPSSGSVDTKRNYLCPLPSGRSIAIYFYDASLAKKVAFEGILKDGAAFAQSLVEKFNEGTETQLVNFATDGESYGHHHRFGEMALAFAIDFIRKENLAKITNYGEFLEHHPPEWEVQIAENTSWSCAHGIERWRSNCGCNSGRYPGANQKWRAPLRNTLEYLADAADDYFEVVGANYFKDVWQAREDYIDVILDRSNLKVDEYLVRNCTNPAQAQQDFICLSLLEMQRCRLLMFTSCGWFFDELSEIHTVQIIKYAARVIELLKQAQSVSELPDKVPAASIIEGDFLDRLKNVVSNFPEIGDGRTIYNEDALKSAVSMRNAAGHYLAAGKYTSLPEQDRVYCFDYARDFHISFGNDEIRINTGIINVINTVTRERGEFIYLSVGSRASKINYVRQVKDMENADEFKTQALEMTRLHEQDGNALESAFDRLEKYFDAEDCDVDLFSDYKIKFLEASAREKLIGLARYLSEFARIPVNNNHKQYSNLVDGMHEFALYGDFYGAVVDLKRAGDIAVIWKTLRARLTGLDEGMLRPAAEALLERIYKMLNNPDPTGENYNLVKQWVEILKEMPFQISFFKVKNALYKLAHVKGNTLPGSSEEFRRLCALINIRIPQ